MCQMFVADRLFFAANTAHGIKSHVFLHLDAAQVTLDPETTHCAISDNFGVCNTMKLTSVTFYAPTALHLRG